MKNTSTNTYQKCPDPSCGFEGNPADVNLCQICRTPLVNKHGPNQVTQSINTAKLNWGAIGLVTLLCGVLGGSGWYLVSYRNQPRANVLEQQSVDDNQTSDIKIYATIKDVANVPRGIFHYGGSICFAALNREGFNQAISEAHPQFQLRYVEPKGNPGCTEGIEMLLDKELSLAQNAEPVSQKEQESAIKRGFELDSIPVAIDGIVFYTHKELGIKSLSLPQVRDIYLGKIKNWQEVGGIDLPITPVSLHPESNHVLQLLMETENISLTESVGIVRDYTTAMRKVAQEPGAISYGSSAILKGQSSIRPIALSKDNNSPPVSALLADGNVNLAAFKANFYPLTRPLFVIIRRDGMIEEKAGVAYVNFLLSEEGQEFLKKAGFLNFDLAHLGIEKSKVMHSKVKSKFKVDADIPLNGFKLDFFKIAQNLLLLGHKP